MCAFAAAAPGDGSPHYNPNNGYILPQPPDDAVSSISLSPASTSSPTPYLIAASWNSSARLWRLDSPQSAAPISETLLPKPLLHTCWHPDGQSAFLSCVDGRVYRWDLASNGVTPVAQHDGAVSQSLYSEQLSCLASVSWDGHLRYWDLRTPPSGTPAADVELSERAYCADAVGVVLVVALAARKLVVFDVRKPATPFRRRYSLLSRQSRALACWPDAMGYAVGAVDGQVSVESIQPNSRDGSFACHDGRNGTSTCINAMQFHPTSGALVTAAADGNVFVWDKSRKSRAKAKPFQCMRAPITDFDILHDGSLYAYAVGYDWSSGVEGSVKHKDPSYIVVQQIDDGDMALGAPGHQGGGGRGRGGRGRRPYRYKRPD